MANLNPVSFLLNQGAEQKQVVSAPAFSLTKVLAAAAVIVTPIATALVNQAKSVTLSAGNYVVLAAAVLAFLALASSADVLARSIATSATTRASAATASTAQMVAFATPLDGHRITDGADPAIKVLATAQIGEPVFLVKEGDAMTWLPTSKITVP
jgi:hypothetical protein